jgi:hypothetical protein
VSGDAGLFHVCAQQGEHGTRVPLLQGPVAVCPAMVGLRPCFPKDAAGSFLWLDLMRLSFVDVLAIMAAWVAFRWPVVKGSHLLRRWSTDGVGACWYTQIKAAVLGFLSHQDQDLFDMCSLI